MRQDHYIVMQSAKREYLETLVAKMRETYRDFTQGLAEELSARYSSFIVIVFFI